MTESTEQLRFFDAIKADDFERVRGMLDQDRSLLNHRDQRSFGATPLNLAVHGEAEMVELLIDYGADVDGVSDWWAGPWNAVQSALQANRRDMAELLVSRGATIGAIEAAGLGRCDTLKSILHDRPAAVYDRGGDGCTPLHFAASVEVARCLVQRGADIEARDVDHYSTPAQYLCRHHPDVSRFLWDQGAAVDVFSVILADDIARLRELLADQPELREARINQEFFPPGPDHDVHNILTFVVGADAPLMHAAATGERLAMIETLVELGVDVNQRGGYDDCTPLHVAAWNDAVSTLDCLIAQGADCNARSGQLHDNTPLGWAIVAGSVGAVQRLLDADAEILDFHRTDAEKGVAGAFRGYGHAASENYVRIRQLLSADG